MSVLSDSDRKLLERRAAWLEKKKMTVRDFSDSVDLDYGTLYRWFHEPRRPHQLYAERVMSKHKDFPLR
jgi:hypothetical protein